MGKLINRISGLRLLISSLPGSALRTHVELPGKLDIKRHYKTAHGPRLIFFTYMYMYLNLGKFSKIFEHFSFCSQIKCWLSEMGFTKCFSE